MDLKKLLRIPNISILISLTLSAFLLSACESPLASLFPAKQPTTESKNVLGLDKIPTYPGSTFLFRSDKDNPAVKSLLDSASSAYHLPTDKTFDDASEYYKSELKEMGWTFIQEVSAEDTTKKPGIYWQKGSKGLRIYSQINDIWYQTISSMEAKSGLSEAIARESKAYRYETQNLLELSSIIDYPWDLKYPDVWEVEQKNASYSNGTDLIFNYSLGGLTIEIEDLGTEFGEDLVSISKNYLDELNKTRKSSERYEVQDDQESGADIVTPSTLNTKEIILKRKDTGTIAQVSFVQHPTNKRYYAIVNIIGDSEFYKYIKDSIKPS